MCTPARGSFNLTVLESSKCVVAIVQSLRGLCKSICDSECTYLLKRMLLCFMDVCTTGLTHDFIYLYVLKMYPDFAESLKQYL